MAVEDDATKAAITRPGMPSAVREHEAAEAVEVTKAATTPRYHTDEVIDVAARADIAQLNNYMDKLIADTRGVMGRVELQYQLAEQQREEVKKEVVATRKIAGEMKTIFDSLNVNVAQVIGDDAKKKQAWRKRMQFLAMIGVGALLGSFGLYLMNTLHWRHIVQQQQEASDDNKGN